MAKQYVQKIFKVYDEAEKHLSKQSVEVDENQLKQTFASVYSPGPSYQFIFDFPTRSFDYVSDATHQLLGIPAEEFTPTRLFEAIHPEDLDHFKQCEELSGYFLLQFLPKELYPFYKISYQFRHRMSDGGYALFLRQSITLSTDEDGNMSKTLANHSNISHITNTNNNKVSFIDIRGQKSYYNISSVEDLNHPKDEGILLSSREIDIVKLISEGFSSKEIARHLFISFDTVRTHRKNVLRKTGMNNMPQVVGYCVRKGII